MALSVWQAFYMHRMAYRRPPRVESTSSLHFRYRKKNEIDFLLCWLEMRDGVGVSGSKVSVIQARWIICVWM